MFSISSDELNFLRMLAYSEGLKVIFSSIPDYLAEVPSFTEALLKGLTS